MKKGKPAKKGRRPEAVGQVFDVNLQIENPCSWWDEHSPADPANREAAMGHIGSCPQCRRGVSRESIRVARSARKTGPDTWELRPGNKRPAGR